jgi:signal transduction histidine kinase
MTAQKLAALSMNLSALKSWAHDCPPEAMALLEEAREQASQCSTDMRTMSYLLHPPLIEELGLLGAMRDYADGFAERSGIRVDLDIPKDFPRLSKTTELTLFRVMQESLANIHQHADSSTASIALTRSESHVILEIRDGGRGIHNEDQNTTVGEPRVGVGIAGMRERTHQVGGRLEIQSTPKGTTVTAMLPLQERPS